MPKKIETDALIIGAGPCGLFQVFELGLLGIDSVLIDSLPTIGGQCTELYPDKPIYDIPGIPVCTGEELIENLSKQIEPFSPKMILGDEVTELEANKDSFDIKTQKGQQITAKTVFIAGGVGSFQPRKIRLKGIDDYENKWLHYRVKDKKSFYGKDIIIAGGGDSALDWAIYFSMNSKNPINLIHRSKSFRANKDSVEKVFKLNQKGKLNLYLDSEVVSINGKGDTLNSLFVKVMCTVLYTFDHSG